MSSHTSGRWRDLGATVWWRQVRSDAWADIVIAVVVAMTALVVAVAPRVLEHAAGRDLAETIATATPDQRNIAFDTRTEIGAGTPSDPFFNIDVFGERLSEEHVPPAVQERVSAERWVVDSPEFVVSSFPDEITGPFPTTFRFRAQEGIEERSQLVAGRLPEAQDPIVRLEGAECPEDVEVETFEPVENLDCAVAVIPFFETAITRQTADDMMLDVGDVVTLRPSTTDAAFRTVEVDTGTLRFALRISGIVELDDEELEFWYADNSLHRPRISENPDFRLVFAVGLLSADQYRALRAAAPGAQLDFTWRFFVDPELIEGADAVQLRSDVAKIAPSNVDVVTSLPELLSAHLAQRRLAVVLVSLSAVGIAAAALASIWVLAAVDGVRRRPVTTLFAARGASRFQLAAHASRTALLVTVPVVVASSLLAWTLFTETRWEPTIVPVAAVTVATWWSVVLGGMPARDRADRERNRLRRIVGEVLILAAAVGAVILLRRRESTVDDAVTGGFDSTLAFAPTLLALAAGLIALRLIGPIARFIARAADRHRSATWFLGARRLVDQPAALRAPIAAITVAASVAVFATVVSTSLGRSQDLAAWQAVGADARVETANPDIPLPASLQDELAVRATSVAFGATLPLQRLEGPSSDFVADVVALDVSAFGEIVGDRAQADSIDSPLDVLDSPARDGVRALLVGPSPGGLSVSVGEIAELERGAFIVPFEFAAASVRFPGVSFSRPTIVVDRGALGAVTDARTVEPTFALLGGDVADIAELRALLDDPSLVVHWTTRADRLAAIAGDPLSTWTARAVWLLAATAIALAVVTAGAGAVITAAARRRELGLLTILGLERRSTAWLVAIEMIPGIVLAALAGAAAGGWTARLLARNLSLAAFAGGGDEAPVVFEWPAIAAVVGILMVATCLAVALTVRSLRHIDHAMLLRKGEV